MVLGDRLLPQGPTVSRGMLMTGMLSRLISCVRRVLAAVMVIVVLLAGAPSAEADSVVGQTQPEGLGPENETTVTLDWTTFPDGSPIPNEAEITDQFAASGVTFRSPPGPPRVLTALGGILISGGPTGFFGDISMSFVDAGLGLPTSITVDIIIGSGLDIGATLEGSAADGSSLGVVTHIYSGPTGQLSPFTFEAPTGTGIAAARFNGALNPAAAASIGTLTLHYQTERLRLAIDIAPGDPRNIIRLRSHATVRIAIFSTPDVDVTTVDPTSLTFARTGTENSIKGCRLIRTAERDERVLLCRAGTKMTGFLQGDREGRLRGRTLSGIEVEGTDSVTIR
jgi:hypothetical protein